jgi:hypothetical protein
MKDTDIQKIIDGLEKIGSIFGCSLIEWRHILQSANSLWSKCPYQIGQAVQLNKTPEITQEKSWGWMGSKHFLIKGAVAHIKTREFYDGRFVFGLNFQDESWIDFEGKIHPKTEESIYCFGESWLEAFDEKRYTEDF